MSGSDEVEHLDYNGHQITITLTRAADGHWLAAAQLRGLSISGRGNIFSNKASARAYVMDLAARMIDMRA